MESNVNLVGDSTKCLKECNSLSNKQLQAQENFKLTLTSLNEIENGLVELDQDLNNVQRNIEAVERLLNNYEREKCEESLKRLEITGQLDYQNACRSKYDDFENYKLKLLNDHRTKAKEIEKLQSVKFKQKSNVFQNNFKKEVEEYKRTGKLPNRTGDQSSVEHEECKTLDEIDVDTDDQDLKALNDFLDN